MYKIISAVCFLLVCSSTLCFSGDKFDYNTYFDAGTGHKYVKLDSASFAEFSQKGKFLKEVPSNLPLLVNNPKVQLIPENGYILYEKASYGVTENKVLPKNSAHPKNWKAKKILVPLN